MTLEETQLLYFEFSTFNRFLDCFIPTFKLKNEYSENMKTDRVISHFQLKSNQTKQRNFFGTPGKYANVFLLDISNVQF